MTRIAVIGRGTLPVDTGRHHSAHGLRTWQLATDGSEELWLDSEGDRMRFRVVSVSATSLELVYLDRGGALSFVKVR